MTPQNAPRLPGPRKIFSAYTQAELRAEMLKDQQEEETKSGETKSGETKSDVYWLDVKRLLQKHGRLTTGDIATMTGRPERSTKASMRVQMGKGKAIGRVIPGNSKIIEWVLP